MIIRFANLKTTLSSEVKHWNLFVDKYVGGYTQKTTLSSEVKHWNTYFNTMLE